MVGPIIEIADNLAIMSRRERTSVVWYNSETKKVHKSSPKYLIDNEFFFLMALAHTGYVPAPVYRIGLEEITMPYIHREEVTDPKLFMDHLECVLDALRVARCRHGDLTEYSVLVHNNKPVIIDFGESRHWDSPLPDKRREGDRYWLTRTMEKLAHGK
jgi:serine/threonine-protein kinase RIO1